MTDTPQEAQNLLDTSDDDLKAIGLPPAFTLEELRASFTDEEIERMNAGDDPLVKMPAKEDAPAPEDDDDAGDDGADAPDDASAAGAGEDAGSGAEAGDGGAGDGDAGQDPDPVYEQADTTEARAIVDSAAEERRKLRSAWQDGDLTDDELDAKQEELDEKIATAKADIQNAERRDQESLTNYANVWHSKVARFLDANPALKDQAPIAELQGDSNLMLFDTVLRSINADARYASMSMNQRIEAGAKLVNAHVQKHTGKTVFDPAASAKAEKVDPKEKALAAAREKAAKSGQRPDPVQTLGDVTAATETEVDNSRFAAIDREESALARERAFASMSPEEQEAYLKGN